MVFFDTTPDALRFLLGSKTDNTPEGSYDPREFTARELEKGVPHCGQRVTVQCAQKGPNVTVTVTGAEIVGEPDGSEPIKLVVRY